MINNYIEKLDSSDIRWFDYLINEKGNEEKALDSILNELDCTKVYNDGSRPMMTINYGYRRNIAGFLYILDNIKNYDVNLAEEYYNKLIARHEENHTFEKNNPVVYYSTKSTRSIKSNKATTKAKDIFSDNTLNITESGAKISRVRENSNTRKARALKDKSISFAFNNFKISK